MNSGIILAQTAVDYFPETACRWEYKVVPLDSLSNEIDTLSYFRHDLNFGQIYLEGKEAKVVQTKSGPEETIELQPYLDSMFCSFSGSVGYEYFKVGYIESLLSIIDSLINDTTFSIVDFLTAQEGWYAVYRFDYPVNFEYPIWQVDTSITFDTLSLPIRLQITGERKEDDSLSTAIGEYDCKKFEMKIRLSYLLMLPPPLPPIPIPILQFGDSIWIAESYWILQTVIPPTNVDLSFLNLPSFYIPGLITKINSYTPIVPIRSEDGILSPQKITLEQNYPNPFNPTTTIKFSVRNPGYATLRIYNTLGEEIDVLLNRELNSGDYEIQWNAEGLPSGIYIYQFKSEGYVETKKMILLK
jgi:hypothetical protein